jgi:hypothetical protein
MCICRLAFFLQETQSAEQAFQALIQGSQTTYIENVFITYTRHLHTDDNPLSVIEGAITQMDRIRERLDLCVNGILQEDGVGEGLASAERISREVRTVVRHLEEILCEAMVDTLLVAHASHRLACQTDPIDVV